MAIVMKRTRGAEPRKSRKHRLWTSRLQAMVDFSLESGNEDELMGRNHSEAMQIKKMMWKQIDLGDHLYGGFEISSCLDLSRVRKYIGYLLFNCLRIYNLCDLLSLK